MNILVPKDQTGTAATASLLQCMQASAQLDRMMNDFVTDQLKSLGIKEVNAVQARLIFNIGEGSFSFGELTTKGCYSGANPAYCLRKLLGLGYLQRVSDGDDRRYVTIFLTPKGRHLRGRLLEVLASFALEVKQNIPLDQLTHVMNTTANELNRHIRHIR